MLVGKEGQVLQLWHSWPVGHEGQTLQAGYREQMRETESEGQEGLVHEGQVS